MSERFGAFISYARAPSAPLAVALQTGLEKFAKPWNRLRAIRVFRDDASMSANSALWSTIERALQEAQAFILLATPEAAASTYVDNEVAWWVRHKGAQRMLLVHAGGTIGWDRAAGEFTVESAIPPALRGAYAEEPRWVDMT
ncbi:TIR domain-containing protein, partial [Mycolicibacterium sp.]|uniref:TIR domain-containing protein n=2 Tax=Mycolicibacterium sp. TaxID=2320850 RepID=UPI003D0DEEE9